MHMQVIVFFVMAVAAAEAVIGLAIIISVFRHRRSLDPQGDAVAEMVATTQAVATVDLLRWMPLIPLLASLINVFFGTRLGRKTAGGLACAAVLATFVTALAAVPFLPATGIFRDTVYTWIESASF